jgi:hypothetical protein
MLKSSGSCGPLRGRQCQAGVDRSGCWIEKQVCWMGYWQVSHKDGCIEEENNHDFSVSNCIISGKLDDDKE